MLTNVPTSIAPESAKTPRGLSFAPTPVSLGLSTRTEAAWVSANCDYCLSFVKLPRVPRDWGSIILLPLLMFMTNVNKPRFVNKIDDFFQIECARNINMWAEDSFMGLERSL
jgi:hypothetical protein